MSEFCAKMKEHAQKNLNPLAQCVFKTEQIDSFQGLHLGTGLLQPEMLISNDLSGFAKIRFTLSIKLNSFFGSDTSSSIEANQADTPPCAPSFS